MDIGRVAAAGGALALHAIVLSVALTLAAPEAMRTLIEPVQVALIRPPEPTPPPPRQEPVKPPEPLPMRKDRPPAPQQKAQTAAAPAAPVVAATPIDEPRAAAITAEAAPATAAHAPRVTEGVPPAASREPAAATAAPVKLGPRLDASWSGNAPPPYPAMARRMGEEGEVRLDVHVGTDGSVIEVRLKKSSGSQLLDQTAIDTVKKWRFKPATVDGRPVAEWYYNWKWVFKLES